MANGFDTFPDDLRRYVQQMQDARQRGAHHDERRHLFLLFLHDALGLKPQEIAIEKDVKAAKVRGLIDTLFQDIVFEFKRDLDAERETGLEELDRYTTAQGTKCFGVLTDGLVFEVYARRGEQLRRAQEPVDLAVLAERDPAGALLWFDSFLFSRKNLPPKSDDVVRRFGPGSPAFVSATTWLQEMWEHLSGDPESRVKFGEWNTLLAKVYGTAEVGTADLFVRHTYLSLLAKVLAYVALLHERPHAEARLRGIVDGGAFRPHGFPNLADPDFFSWVLHPAVRPAFLTVMRGFVQALGVYDLASIEEDLLKELYQQLVDPETRHDLGEYYTPDWLAELTLREAGYRGSGSLLDPACGSGTFLFTAIQKAREEGLRGARLVAYALENVMGLDVHPLAVTTARINYALAIAPDLRAYQGAVYVPVFMADALLREERKDNGPIEVLVSVKERTRGGRKRVVEEKFVFPADMARDPGRLDEAVRVMCEYARQEGDKQHLAAGFVQYLQQKSFADPWLPFWRHNLNLMVDLVRQKRDTIWGFILRNAYRPIFFAQRGFDLVVGNPPWLAYRYIQDRRYQAQVKALVFHYGLLDKGDVKLFTVMDTSTLFYEFCWDRYRRHDGTLAFVMPKSVLTGAKQHAGFQRTGFTRVVDLEDVRPLFNVPSCALVRRAERVATADIPTLIVRGDLPGRNLNWERARSFLREHRDTYSPLRPEERSYYYPMFREGATIVPRCFWFVRPAAGPGFGVTDPEKPYLETNPEVHADAKRPWKGMRFEGEVESQFLFATLLGRNLLPFGHVKMDLIVLPLLPVGKGPRMHLIRPDDALSHGYPGMAQWLRPVSEAWESGKKRESERTVYDRLDYQHTLTGQNLSAPFRVVYNKSGTHIAACIVELRSLPNAAGLPIRGFAAEMVTYYLETTSGAEAHYLVAVLNSDVVNEAIKAYQPRGQWGERDVTRLPFEVLPIPRYDRRDLVHRKLATISRACHRKVAALAPKMTSGTVGTKRQEVRRILRSERAQIDELVFKLLGDAPPRVRARPSHNRGGGLFG